MERAREWVAVLLNDVWHIAVVKSRYVSSEFSGLNSCFQGLTFVWWWDTSPLKEMVKKEILEKVLERHGPDSG